MEAGLEAKVKSSAWAELRKGEEEVALVAPEPRMAAVAEEQRESGQRRSAEGAEEPEAAALRRSWTVMMACAR